MKVGQRSTLEMNDEEKTPKMMPIMPPNRLSTTASIRNCPCTSPSVAPMAMRMPISRVRSVTETSMIFMMPMPPTISETEAIEASSMVSTCPAWSARSAISVMLRTEKSSSSSWRMRWRCRSRLVICCWATKVASLLTACTEMKFSQVVPSSFFCTVT